MKKIKVTKQDVYDAVSLVIAAGLIPTHELLRTKLGKGSDTTIHKYFKQWKKARLFGEKLENKYEIINQQSLEDEKKCLQYSLDKQISQNEYYAQELIDAEKNNVLLKEQIHKLQISNQQTQLKLSASEKTNNALEQLNKEIQSKLDISINTTIQKMQQTIDDLRLELKTLNETYINALRETSTQGHEALMQEKVNSINLQTKIDNLTKELLDSKKKAYEASMTAQVQNRSLSRQNEQLQKILQENGLDKLWSAEGSSLAFTNGAAVDGK